jgi:hypothetical protein
MNPGFSIWTIYKNPLDYPGKFVVRRSITYGPRLILHCHSCTVSDTLEEARATVPRGLYPFARMDGDEAHIVETWL